MNEIMNEINREFSKSRGFGFVETLNGYLFTPEANAHTFRIQCVVQEDNLETVVPFETGSVVSARFLKSDHVTELVEGSLDENGAAVVPLTAECYAVPGRFLLTIFVAYNSISVCVYAATGTVIAADSSTVNVSENASREIDEKIAELNAAAAQVSSAISAGSAKITEINQAAAQQRQSVNDLGDQLKSYLEDHYGETTDKVAAKANRSSVSTVKHATGTDGQITLTDALNEPAKKMTIHLEPKQDLHGYDRPWVGGAGKNIANIGDYVFVKPDTRTLTKNLTPQIPAGSYVFSFDISGTASGFGITFRNSNNQDIISTINGEASSTVYCTPSENKRVSKLITLSETAIKFYMFITNNNSDGATTNIANVMLTPSTETDQTFAPYENICPIEGYDTVKADSIGKNLLVFDKKKWNTDGSFMTQANAIASPLLAVNPGDKLMARKAITFTDGSLNTMARFFGADKKYLYSRQIMAYNNLTGTYKVPDNAYYVGVTQFVSDGTAQVRENVKAHVEISTTLSEYEPPVLNSVSLNLVSSAGSTVYGGTVAVNEDGSGTLVVDRVLKQVLSSDIKYSSKVLAGRYLTVGNYIIDKKSNSIHVCNAFSSSVLDNTGELGVCYFSNSNQFVCNTSFASIDDFKAWIDANGLHIVYQLDTPLLYPLTAAQLQTLAGTNHILTDGTNIELDYYGDKYCTYEQVMELIANALKS